MLAGLKIEAEVYVPLMLHGLCAGFPSPADDYIEESIDLTKLLIRNPPATFLWKVDRSLRPVDGDIVVATVHGERSLKRLRMTGGRPRLMFENSDMPLFNLPEIAEVEIWGVALCNVHWLRPRKQG
ncbi:S24 family peptidase [Rhizobium sp. FKY42]|uniref:LexA family protein n=1 Tax=Rhizobium sp. FKY42 TaxID=2562310 RepID=UPI0010BF7698|nr:S24 family peptidase [Rhizobium sp. FKY42]